MEYSLLWQKHLSFAGFTDEHNTLPKSTRRKVKLNKFAFENPWLPDLLCKHWFTSSVWNFCRWVADVPPRETSLSGDEREETSAVRRLICTLSLCIHLSCSSFVFSSRQWSCITVFEARRKKYSERRYTLVAPSACYSSSLSGLSWKKWAENLKTT